ncbi:ABC-type sulfate/molybdate transport systems, ATPase component [Mycolicibacterium conceptionense]|uniref:ABC-type sulfate/molybdate transport systems, ATPase component n=1 Tax=Mycolicibacterium conceptionense TaxID=451644 RepID=A0A0U1DME5_9MYCO|nr:ABC-type sulfate/molybdate transport systems, ATPase component [Mycolicibacterium conceptionense]
MTSETTLQVRAVLENRGLDVEFGVPAGEVLAVLGPNGAGKSTTLHAIAALVGLDAGHIRVGDRMLTDTASGIHVPTHARRVGLLLQDALLFPHLSAVANVAFAARSGGPVGAALRRLLRTRTLRPPHRLLPHWSRVASTTPRAGSAMSCPAAGRSPTRPSCLTGRRC